MTAAWESQASPSTTIDICTYRSTANDIVSSTSRNSPIAGLPFRASLDANSVHAALSAYLTSFGFLCLLLFTFLNMRMLSSPSLSTAAGERAEHITVFCCYSLCLILVLLFFAHYFHRVMSGSSLRAKCVRDSDRVLLDGQWLEAQRAHTARYDDARAVGVWSVIRSDQSVLTVLTVLLSLYCCASLLLYAVHVSAVERVVLLLVSGAAITVATLSHGLLACVFGFALSDWLAFLLTTLVGCPVLHSLSDGLLLVTCQLLLCVAAYIAARVSSRPVISLLFSSTFHSRLVLVSLSRGSLLSFVTCLLSSLPLHRMAAQQPHSNAAMETADDSDDADISEEIWHVRQFVCMAAVYAVAANGWRCMNCLLGDGVMQDAAYCAALLVICILHYTSRERHKQG